MIRLRLALFALSVIVLLAAIAAWWRRTVERDEQFILKMRERWTIAETRSEK